MLHLNVRSAAGLGLLEIVFVFLFVDIFDNIGTLMAVTKKADCSIKTTESRA